MIGGSRVYRCAIRAPVPTDLPPCSDPHSLAEPSGRRSRQIAEAVAGRLLGIASDEMLLWERTLVASDPEAARLARACEDRLRWLMANAEDPVDQFERLTGRRLDAPEG